MSAEEQIKRAEGLLSQVKKRAEALTIFGLLKLLPPKCLDTILNLNVARLEGLSVKDILEKIRFLGLIPSGGGGGGSGSGSGDATSIKGKAVDDSAIGDQKALTYDQGSDKIIYSSPAGKVKTTLSFAVTGTLTTGTDRAPTLVAPCVLTLTKVKAVVKTAPSGQAIIVDINKAGTTIFTTQANRPQIAVGQTQGDSGTPDVSSLAEGDKITVDIDQVGSGTAGADLTIEVVADQPVTFT